MLHALIHTRCNLMTWRCVAFSLPMTTASATHCYHMVWTTLLSQWKSWSFFLFFFFFLKCFATPFWSCNSVWDRAFKIQAFFSSSASVLFVFQPLAFQHKREISDPSAARTLKSRRVLSFTKGRTSDESGLKPFLKGSFLPLNALRGPALFLRVGLPAHGFPRTRTMHCSTNTRRANGPLCSSASSATPNVTAAVSRLSRALSPKSVKQMNKKSSKKTLHTSLASRTAHWRSSGTLMWHESCFTLK